MKHILAALSVLALFACTSPVQNADRAPSSKLVVDPSGYAYDPNDRSCDGFPRLLVETMPGTCLGLVVGKKPEFKMLRTLLPVPGTSDMLVVDMGGWKPNNGSLFLLKNRGGRYEVKKIKEKLANPHGFRLGADGFFYLGETHQISRFHLVKDQVADWQLVFQYPERQKGYMHPLMQFAFDPVTQDIIINAGSPSDHCYNKGEFNGRCPESEMKGFAGLFLLEQRRMQHIPPGGVQIYQQMATGLRNSMALVVHDSGTVIQGENSRDFSELEEPYEEINVLDVIGADARNTTEGPENPRDRRAMFFGWPYCYDFFAQSPEWANPENKNAPLAKAYPSPVPCKLVLDDNLQRASWRDQLYQPPHSLIPPHAAPLHADYYRGSMFPQLKGKLLMTWHGYQPTGHRLVAYPVDDKGRPIVTKDPALMKEATYGFDVARGCASKRKFSPHGGMLQHAFYSEVISHWNEVKGQRPQGAPVGFTEAADGSIWIAEDRKNNTIVRLARTDRANFKEDCHAGPSVDLPDPRIELLVWRSFMNETPEAIAKYEAVQAKLIHKFCAECHGQVKADDINKNDRYANLDFIMKNSWVTPQNAADSKMYGAITHSGEYPPMPPGGQAQFFGTPEGEDIARVLADFIGALPSDIEKRYKKMMISTKTSLRDQPKSARKCGMFKAQDIAYIDPRPGTQIKDNQFTWFRMFVLPDDSRLFMGPDACPYPTDDVFYFPVKNR